ALPVQTLLMGYVVMTSVSLQSTDGAPDECADDGACGILALASLVHTPTSCGLLTTVRSALAVPSYALGLDLRNRVAVARLIHRGGPTSAHQNLGIGQ